MTKGEIINLYGSLQKLGNLKGVKFAYAVARNLSLIKPEVEALEKALETSEEFNEYDKKRIELAKKFAKKDEKGEAEKKQNFNPQGQVVSEEFVLENEVEFKKEFETLKEENKKVLEARETQIKEQNELLKTDSTLQLYKIALVDVPTDISTTQMNAIIDIISEDIPSPYKS